MKKYIVAVKEEYIRDAQRFGEDSKTYAKALEDYTIDECLWIDTSGHLIISIIESNDIRRSIIETIVPMGYPIHTLIAFEIVSEDHLSFND